ncbi:MAG: DUF3604 domain-containing protein [Candidatus Diapherotrites archaeon]
MNRFFLLVGALLLFLGGGTSVFALSSLEYSGPDLFPTDPSCQSINDGCPNPHYTSFSFTYTSDQAISPNGGFRIGIGWMFNGLFLGDLLPNWGSPQFFFPSFPNYTTVSSPVPFSTSKQCTGSFCNSQVSFPNGLPSGTPVTVLFGDTSGGSPGILVPAIESNAQVFLSEDFSGSQTFVLAPDPHPRLHVTGTHADRVVVIGPSTVNVGEYAMFVAKVMEGPDAYEHNSFTDGNFLGTFSFSSTDFRARMPPTVGMSLADGGVRKFWIRFSTPGIHSVNVHANGVGVDLVGVSNPIEVRSGPVVGTPSSPVPDNYNLYWGSLHNHTAVGGHALSTTEQAFDFGREYARLDFLSMSEHCGTEEFNFAELENMADARYIPRVFVTFPAYEWTSSSEGHRHAIFKDSASAFSFCDTGTNQIGEQEQLDSSLSTFLSDVGSVGGIAILHHPSWNHVSGVNWGSKDSNAQRLVEIYSWHGRSEYYNNPLLIHNSPSAQFDAKTGNFVQDALASGYRLGITADADNHFGMPGSNATKGWLKGFYARNGLTAVYAPSLTRDSVWSALNARRVYGTTGARIQLKFTSGSHWMGEEFSSVSIPSMSIRVLGTTPLDYVKIFRDGKEEVFSWTGDGSLSNIDLQFTDTNVIPSNTYSYYVRVHQANDHYAWSSPMWITYLPARFSSADSSALYLEEFVSFLYPPLFSLELVNALVDSATNLGRFSFR